MLTFFDCEKSSTSPWRVTQKYRFLCERRRTLRESEPTERPASNGKAQVDELLHPEEELHLPDPLTTRISWGMRKRGINERNKKLRICRYIWTGDFFSLVLPSVLRISISI